MVLGIVLVSLVASLVGCITPPALDASLSVDTQSVEKALGDDVTPVEILVDAETVLRGYHLDANGADGYVMLHLLPAGATSGSIETLAVEALLDYKAMGISSLVYDYNGVGLSDGPRNADLIVRDVDLMFADAVERAAGRLDRVLVRSHSLGTIGAASLMHEQLELGGLILISPVHANSVGRRFADTYYGGFEALIAGLFLSGIDAPDLVEAVARCKSPLLVIASDDDKLLTDSDREHLRANVSAAGGEYVAKNGDHIIFGSEASRLFPEEARFIQRVAVSDAARCLLAQLPPAAVRPTDRSDAAWRTITLYRGLNADAQQLSDVELGEALDFTETPAAAIDFVLSSLHRMVSGERLGVFSPQTSDILLRTRAELKRVRGARYVGAHRALLKLENGATIELGFDPRDLQAMLVALGRQGADLERDCVRLVAWFYGGASRIKADGAIEILTEEQGWQLLEPIAPAD